MRFYASLLCLVATLAVAKGQAVSCTARNNRPCVTLKFDAVPKELPVSLHVLAGEWLRSDAAGEDRVYESMNELHAQIESEWRQVYPDGGEGTGNPWSVERKFLVGRAKVLEPWTSLLMIERHYFGGAHGNYRVVSQTVTESDALVTWADLLERSTDDVGTLVHEHLARQYRGYDFNEDELLPPDAWRATAEYLELWWEPYRIGPFSLEYYGLPRVRIPWNDVLSRGQRLSVDVE